MDALHRLQFQIMQDELHDRWNNLKRVTRSILPKRQHKIGVSLAEVSHESEGRVWVEVGNEGLRLRVSHLHPANPSVADALRRKCSQRRQSISTSQENFFMGGHIIYPPEDDKISLTSLEDYWFNHWQGPFITADTNQNSYGLTRLRRSCRISKRNNRCSMCHKKRVVKTDTEEPIEGNCVEREENVLAHMPSVKLDSRVLKDENDEKSDDDISKISMNEDTLSRHSTTEDHLSRVNRILDNEIRTSLTLFVNDSFSQDVVDSNIKDTTPERILATTTSTRQSRSCPCSPKLSRRTYSPESISNSPKSRSYLGSSSKFSLSSSLLAIHRQASNTLIMPEFLKFESGKAESPGASKTNSLHNSLRSETKKNCQTLSENLQMSNGSSNNKETFPCLESFPSSSSVPSEEANCGELDSMPSKCPVNETQSLPHLRLSKMSLTYRSGVMISEENEVLDSDDDNNEELSQNISTGASTSSFQNNIFDGDKNAKHLLPDVVPMQESDDQTNVNHRRGVINLGFDGLEESSDFNDSNYVTKVASDNASKPDGRSRVPCNRSFSAPLESQRPAFSDATKMSENFPPIIQPSSSNDEVHNNFPTRESAERGALSKSNEEHAIISDEARDYNTFIEKDVMQEARDLVFWWRKKSTPSEKESEFCVHETECKVKQKPLLLFLHGVGSSADVWNQQLWYFLSCGYEVVAPDLLGHGMSSAPKDKKYYSFSNMLDYISLVFDLFVPQGRKCIVIGHNYGCALAVALARGRPLSVGLVVLASCGGPNPLAPNNNEENSFHSAVIRLLHPFISCGCLSRELLYTARGKHYEPVISDDKPVSATPRYVIENTCLGQYWPEGDLAFHRRITIPTLLLHGMKDDKISFVEMCEMEKTIPRAFLELIPGAGHELMTDSPTEVCHAMHRFIRRWKTQTCKNNS